MRKMMRYGKAYGAADPEMIEGDVFRIILKAPEFQQITSSAPQSGQLAPEVTPEVKKMPFIMSAKLWKNAKKIQGDLQGMANNNPVKSQSIKIIEDT